MPAKLSIIVPAYNESNTIQDILQKIDAVQLIDGIEKEIIVVNDCSKDNTEQQVLEFQKNNPTIMAISVLFITFSFAVFSWFVIERRFLDRFKQSLVTV